MYLFILNAIRFILFRFTEHFGIRVIDHTILWQRNLLSEQIFWRNWIESKGGRWPQHFSNRIASKRALKIDLAKLLPCNSCQVKILDVGAGPLTVLGNYLQGFEISITPIDALADSYDQMLRNARIVAPVPTIKMRAEELVKHYPENHFDLSYSRNAIDHTHDAIRSILAMVHVTKVGGYVVLEHRIAEGRRARYRGLHAWNFLSEKDTFYISSPNGRQNMNQLLNDKCRIKCRNEHNQGWLTIEMEKL
jgi:SAM-dependent methyltransferase